MKRFPPTMLFPKPLSIHGKTSDVAETVFLAKKNGGKFGLKMT